MPGFKKSERLSGQMKIESLFEDGNSFFVYPFKVFWLTNNEIHDSPAQILISVPRKKFKNAVTRNLLKRRIREIYRKNKALLYEHLVARKRHCLLALIYTEQQILKSAELEPKIIVILQRLMQENEKIIG